MRLLTYLLIAINMFEGCKHTTEPPISPPKDPRTYTWTVDTLAYPENLQTNMYSTWGSSPSDVYAVGHSDGGGGRMWHFDGVQWQPVKINATEGGPIVGIIDLQGVYGFSSKDVWAVGERLSVNPAPPPNFLDSSFILHFDGSQWREFKVTNGRFLTTIRGLSSNDVWTCGLSGTLFHYNGTQWQRDSVPISLATGSYFDINTLGLISSSNVYLSGYVGPSSSGLYYLFHRQNSTWTMIDSASSSDHRWGVGDMWTSPSGTTYSCGYGVFKLVNGSWVKMIDTQYYLYRIVGTSDNSIFVAGDYNLVMHYNGTDWHTFTQFNGSLTVFMGAWANATDIFIVGVCVNAFPQVSVVLHGH